MLQARAKRSKGRRAGAGGAKKAAAKKSQPASRAPVPGGHHELPPPEASSVAALALREVPSSSPSALSAQDPQSLMYRPGTAVRYYPSKACLDCGCDTIPAQICQPIPSFGLCCGSPSSVAPAQSSKLSSCIQPHPEIPMTVSASKALYRTLQCSPAERTSAPFAHTFETMAWHDPHPGLGPGKAVWGLVILQPPLVMSF